MIKETRFVALYNQKGGVGKSTCAINLATSIWYDTDLKWDVALWDCDNPQFSTSRSRANDIDDIPNLIELLEGGKMKSYKKYFDAMDKVSDLRNTKEIYPIISIVEPLSETTIGEEGTDIVFVKDAFKNVIDKFDVVLLDLPGKIDSKEMIALLPIVDYLLIPIDYDDQALDTSIATIKFIVEFTEKLKEQPSFMKNKQIFIFFAKFKKSITKNKQEYAVNKIIKRYPFVKAFKNSILEAENIKDSPLKTIFPLQNDNPNNEHYCAFYKEFLKTIK